MGHRAGWSNREGGEETEVAGDETENQRHIEKLSMLGSVPNSGGIRLRPLGIRAPSRLGKASGSVVRHIGIGSVAGLKSFV
jgi:hypothetical protein